MSTPSTPNAPAKTRRRLALPSARGLLTTTAMVAGAAILGVSAAGGSFASWKVGAPVTATAITSGSLGLTINGVTDLALDGTTWSQLLPGDVAFREVTVSNTGTTPVTIIVGSNDPTTTLEVRAQSGACAGTIIGDSATTTPTKLDGTLDGGTSITVCIQVSLTPSAAENQSAPFSMTFTADQVRP